MVRQNDDTCLRHSRFQRYRLFSESVEWSPISHARQWYRWPDSLLLFCWCLRNMISLNSGSVSEKFVLPSLAYDIADRWSFDDNRLKNLLEFVCSFFISCLRSEMLRDVFPVRHSMWESVERREGLMSGRRDFIRVGECSVAISTNAGP